MCDRNPAAGNTLESPMSGVIRIAVRRFSQFFRGSGRTSPEDLLHAARVLLWVRWFGSDRRFRGDPLPRRLRLPEPHPQHLLLPGIPGGQRVCSVAHTPQGDGQAVLAVRTQRPGPGGHLVQRLPFRRLQQPLLPVLYYFAVAVFAYVFTSPRLVLPWTTLVAAVYSVLSFVVEPGLDIAGKDEQHLFYRVVALYAVSAAVGIIAGLERESRRRGLERERELQRQRIEISQTIHDTTAQWAYMIGLGVEGAMELADESQEALKAKLRLVAELSRSAMWELRHPIDGGQIFRGEELGEVLEAHAATFTVISSVPAELVQHGREPPLSIIDRSLLFSIAHNALTNVVRHANASEVVIGLDCDGEELRLSVSDDGGGLPPDYETRGHGFRNMRADAERMGGRLEVESDGDGGGTTVTCVVPYRTLREGE